MIPPRSLSSALAALTTLAATLSAAFGQGALTPPGAPAPTMKTLDQVEARTPIAGGTAAVTISVDGSYYLTGNITVLLGNVLNITANNVTIDLNGFTIFGTNTSASNGTAIDFTGNGACTVRNGHIKSATTFNSGTGAFTNGGFLRGVFVESGTNACIENVDVYGVGGNGISVVATSATISRCQTNITGGTGIVAPAQQSTVDHCVVQACSGVGIQGGMINDCIATSQTAQGINAANNATNCTGISNGTGAANVAEGVSAIIATNCYGTSTVGYGVAASNAVNCYGTTTTAQGVDAISAVGCRGYATTGIGINASQTDSCYGSCTSGIGIQATVVTNSSAVTSTGKAITCATATNCSAFSYVGTATSNCIVIDCGTDGVATGCQAEAAATNSISIRAAIANGCVLRYGTSVITNKYNMP